MDGSAVKEIERLAKAGLLVKNADGAQSVLVQLDKLYSTVPLHDPRKPAPQPIPMTVHSLSGLLGYVEANRDNLSLASLALVVESPTRVSLVSQLYGDFLQRNTFVVATALPRMEATEFEFGEYEGLEGFIIALQALFVDNPDRAKVLQLLGNVRDEAVRTAADDGTTQVVTARAGIALVQDARVPNPVTLQPYRTFSEVEQPASMFILRLRQGNGQIQAALFEADGGAWQLTATDAVATYLRDRQQAVVVLA